MCTLVCIFAASLGTTGSYSYNVHTSKDGAELLPAGDTALRGKLTEGNLQEEDWQTTTKQENEVRDEKCTWAEEKKDRVTEDKMFALTVTMFICTQYSNYYTVFKAEV